jgi:protein-tyrosine phosphatase
MLRAFSLETFAVKKVLFLCTGNYYRSRFAEVVFNHLARQAGLDWTADSCGLRVQADGVVNVGPLSPFAEAGLEMRLIPIPQPCRYPRQVTAEDLAGSEIIIGLKEKEHRPLMETLFPDQVARVRFWNIHDLDAGHPIEALRDLEAQIEAMVRELRGPSASDP